MLGLYKIGFVEGSQKLNNGSRKIHLGIIVLVLMYLFCVYFIEKGKALPVTGHISP
jgi:hypothetical protein